LLRIDLLESAPLSLARKEPLTIARGSYNQAHLMFVFVHIGNLVGQGCAAPSEVTKESMLTVTNAMQALAKGLRGFEFLKPAEVADRMDRIVPGNPSAKAAIDIAVHDVLARTAGVPLFRYLGGTADRMATDITIGIMPTPAAVDRARRWVSHGFRALKVKIGSNPHGDVERVRAIRAAVGPSIELRVDGNQGYSWGQALQFVREVKDLNVAFLEQPTAASDYEGMRVLNESSPVPIMADEMVLTADDAKKVKWGNAAKSVNLKLMKHGGIARATEVDTICSSAALPTMVGCMGEPQLSIAAGLHFALASKNVRWLDLDSHFNLAADPSTGLRFIDGQLIAPDKPGLGIDVEWPA
jgi:L-Ala-D/L-Glu epimerase / N-acetyl-D-glutamate racemase